MESTLDNNLKNREIKFYNYVLARILDGSYIDDGSSENSTTLSFILKSKYEGLFTSENEELNLDSHNTHEGLDPEFIANLIKEIDAFQDKMTEYDTNFSNSSYFNFKSQLRWLLELKNDMQSVIKAALFVATVEYHSDYSIEVFDELSNIENTLFSSISSEDNEELQELRELLRLKVSTIKSIICSLYPDKSLKYKFTYNERLFSKESIITADTINDIIRTINGESKDGRYHKIKSYSEKIKYKSDYYDNYLKILEAVKNTKKNLDVNSIFPDEPEYSDTDNSSFNKRVINSHNRFVNNSKLSFRIKKNQIQEIKNEGLTDREDDNVYFENYYQLLRLVDYYSKVIENSNKSENIKLEKEYQNIKSELNDLLDKLHKLRITPYKTTVVPFLLPKEDCLFSFSFVNTKKEYKLLLLHPLIKLYNSVAVNNQIEKKIFGCYQMIAKIDALVLDNKAKAQYNAFKKEAEKQQEELKAERVRSVEILSIFAAVAMFSAGSIKHCGKPKHHIICYNVDSHIRGCIAIFRCCYALRY